MLLFDKEVKTDLVEIKIDKKWSLVDFTYMTKLYTQCYTLIY
jgi:hypothetical protein